MFSRRSFLTTSLSGSVLLSAGCKSLANSSSAGARQIKKVGIQTYTLRDVFEKDPMTALRMIKNVGYDYVELNSRNFTLVAPEKLRAMIDEVGLSAPASHISLDMIKGDMAELMDTAKTLGVEYLTVPWVNDDVRSFEDWKSHARLMNHAGEKLRDNGFKLAYHNHQFEFIDLGGGTTALDILLNDTRDENLAFQLDIFWAYLAKVDIAALFKQNPGRFKLCHVKDMTKDRDQYQTASYEDIGKNIMVNVGEGVIPFESYFALNDISGMEYFVTEHDHPNKPYENAIRTSYEAVKDMRF